MTNELWRLDATDQARLIRTGQDRGSVVILDPRMLTKPYGRTFLDSLPPARVVVERYTPLEDI